MPYIFDDMAFEPHDTMEGPSFVSVRNVGDATKHQVLPEDCQDAKPEGNQLNSSYITVATGVQQEHPLPELLEDQIVHVCIAEQDLLKEDVKLCDPCSRGKSDVNVADSDVVTSCEEEVEVPVVYEDDVIKYDNNDDGCHDDDEDSGDDGDDAIDSASDVESDGTVVLDEVRTESDQVPYRCVVANVLITNASVIKIEFG
jgi:hypothetical protein